MEANPVKKDELMKLFKGMTDVEKVAFPVILFFVLESIFLAFVNVRYFESFIVERSGLLKQFQPMCMVTIAGLSFYRAWVFRKIKPVTFIVGSILIGFLFTFALGETLTWGQRIFEFPTPEFFMKYNTQQMFTIHNLAFDGVKINKLVFGLILGIITVLYAIVGTAFYRSDSSFGRLIDRWGIPLAQWHHIVFLALCFGLSKLVMSGKKNEVVQFASMAVFVLIFYNPLNKKNFTRQID
jgi:hypothetical protein